MITKLKMAMTAVDVTQTELAKELNVSFATISRWENGKAKPTKKALLTFIKFCRDNNIKFECEDN